MAMNPMQRKANNSFLLGFLIALLIGGAIIAFLMLQLSKLNNEKKEREANLKDAYVLSSDINSGDTVSADKLSKVKIEKSSIPSNAATIADLGEATISKINLKKGTVLATDMLTESEDKTTDDLRMQEYNMVVLPSQLTSDEYIDIRLRLPDGTDYLVVSKKRVEVPQISGIDSENSIWVKLTEDEILSMSNAIVEAYWMKGSVLYADRYVEPGLQKKATQTYVPSAAVQSLMSTDPNITQEAKNALFLRYNANVGTRNSINGQLNAQSEEGTDNLQEGVQKEIEDAREQRQKYLEALMGE